MPKFDSKRAETTAIRGALKAKELYASIEHGDGTLTGKIIVRLHDKGEPGDGEERRRWADEAKKIITEVTGRGENEMWVV